MYVDTPYTRFKSLMPKQVSLGPLKRAICTEFLAESRFYSLFSATNFRNLQQSDWLQDRIDSWLIESAT